MEYYNYIKILHIIAVVAWFAGLFYIFRLFVYHVQNKSNPEISKVFETMEGKLLKIIMLPAMITTLATGTWMLVLMSDWLKMPWLHVKLLFVGALIIYHLYSVHTWKRFKLKDYFLSEKACRIINEVPTLALIIIVIMVIIKPHI